MSDAAPRPAVLMFIAHRAAEARVMDALAAAGVDDITLAQSRLMQRLDDDGLRLTELAARAQVTKQTAGALIDQLERVGYVRRELDPSDARARLVIPTSKARRLREVTEPVVDDVERQWREHLGDKAFDQMTAALVKLRDITDPFV